MIIGLLGFGKVAQNLVELIKSDDVTFITSAESRSDKTVDNLRKSNVEVSASFKEVALAADILISANSPKSALSVAKDY